MKKLFALLLFSLPVGAYAGGYQQTLLVQTGVMSEGDLVVRNVSDLGSNKTCLAFYVRTSGTSPVIQCYHAVTGFGANLSQVGHIKVEDLVIRKLDDVKNRISCLVAYVSTPGTSPGVDCYPYKQRFKDTMDKAGHLREGDLDVYKVNAGNMRACVVAYVRTEGTSPAILCYDSKGGKGGGMRQVSLLKEGDLIVRKIIDASSREACLFTYVSTKGTSPHLFCYDEPELPEPTKRIETPRR